MERIQNITDKLILGIKGYPLSFKNKLLKEHGNDTITNITIVKQELSGLSQNALNFISFGETTNIKQNNEDINKLYHLYIIIKTNKTRFFLEKNATLNFGFNVNIRKNAQKMEVNNIPSGIRLIDFLENTRRRVGDDKFFTYQSADKNCQEFVYDLLSSNGIATQEYKKFVLQNTRALFKDNSLLRKAVNTGTDVLAIGSTLMDGGSLKMRNPNKWVTHVKTFATNHNITYGQALKHPDVKNGYK